MAGQAKVIAIYDDHFDVKLDSAVLHRVGWDLYKKFTMLHQVQGQVPFLDFWFTSKGAADFGRR
ncbi:hypothetical protein AOU00_08045 [Paenibacillus polymyxa]|nr:hypothetical protein AOU00_08045 [Paenibacillus polymyxa]KYG95030.1 hypothetical protein AZE31_14580 [Paenibacillus polymyxa]